MRHGWTPCAVTLYSWRVQVPKSLQIGPRLKSTRKARRLSLRELGAATGFSASFLSQVERGEASPSLSSLDKIVRALGLTLGALLTDPDSAPPGPLVRRQEPDTLHSEWSKASLRSLMPAGTQGPLAALLVTLEPGGRTGKHFLAEQGHIFGFCVRGQPTLLLDERSHELNQQDSVYYDATKQAVWENHSRGPAEVLLVQVRGA
ncbi:MAG: XRE family transcriptional regulator [Myxococcota bacterium]